MIAGETCDCRIGFLIARDDCAIFPLPYRKRGGNKMRYEIETSCCILSHHETSLHYV